MPPIHTQNSAKKSQNYTRSCVVILSIPAQGHTEILRYLLENLENRSDVNVLDHIHATPAHDAAEYGQMESMLLLLKNGADISIKDTVRKMLCCNYPDTNGGEKSVRFRRLKCMQEWYLWWEKVSCLVRCPHFREVARVVLGVGKGVLFREVSSFQG